MPRLRLSLLWLGLITCLLQTVLWLVTVWFQLIVSFGDRTSQYLLTADSGAVTVVHLRTAPAGGRWGIHAYRQRHTPSVEIWTPKFDRVVRGSAPPTSLLQIVIPLWLPIVLTAFPTAYLYLRQRRDRRPRPGACPRCAYPLTGLAPNSACPECGNVSAS